MIIRFAEEKDIEQINKLLVQVNSIHHRGRPDLFKSAETKTVGKTEKREKAYETNRFGRSASKSISSGIETRLG